MNDTVM